jgi:hypothetical protein
MPWILQGECRNTTPMWCARCTPRSASSPRAATSRRTWPPYFDPACEYYPVEEADPVRGREALVRWNRRWFEAWDVFEAIVACIQVEGRGGASGMSVAQPFFHVIQMRDGRVTRMREFLEEDQATARSV